MHSSIHGKIIKTLDGLVSNRCTVPLKHLSAHILEGCQHGGHLRKRRANRMWKLSRYISSFCSRQYHSRCSARDAVWLSFEPEQSGHDLLPAITPGRVNRSRSTSVYCLCRLHEAIRHRWEDWTVVAAEEIWMPRKVNNHDRKSAYRNDGQHQEWRGGLGYICYNI